MFDRIRTIFPDEAELGKCLCPASQSAGQQWWLGVKLYPRAVFSHCSRFNTFRVAPPSLLCMHTSEKLLLTGMMLGLSLRQSPALKGCRPSCSSTGPKSKPEASQTTSGRFSGSVQGQNKELSSLHQKLSNPLGISLLALQTAQGAKQSSIAKCQACESS